jgi:hypothetical protein
MSGRGLSSVMRLQGKHTMRSIVVASLFLAFMLLPDAASAEHVFVESKILGTWAENCGLPPYHIFELINGEAYVRVLTGAAGGTLKSVSIKIDEVTKADDGTIQLATIAKHPDGKRVAGIQRYRRDGDTLQMMYAKLGDRTIVENGRYVAPEMDGKVFPSERRCAAEVH